MKKKTSKKFEESLKKLKENRKLIKTRSIGRPSKFNLEKMKRATYYKNNWRKLGKKLPTLEGLAIYLGVSIKTVEKWKGEPEKEDFIGVCDAILTEQTEELIQGSFEKETAAPHMSKLLMTKQGYTEKTQHEVESKKLIIKVDPRDVGTL